MLQNMIYNIIEMDDTRKTKENKEKLRNYLRNECPYQILFDGDSITFKNRDYKAFYGIINNNNLQSINIIEQNMQLYKNGERKLEGQSFYLYNDGSQPYLSKKYLKIYLKQLEFLKEYLP